MLHFPVVLFDTAYWRDLLAWVRDELLSRRMISPEDVDLLATTDDPADAVEIVIDCYERRCAEVPSAPHKADAQ